MCSMEKQTDKVKSTDITKRFEELGIIAFDGAGTAVKEDVITALNAIEAHMNVKTDEELYNHIKELQNAKKERRNALRRG